MYLLFKFFIYLLIYLRRIAITFIKTQLRSATNLSLPPQVNLPIYLRAVMPSKKIVLLYGGLFCFFACVGAFLLFFPPYRGSFHYVAAFLQLFSPCGGPYEYFYRRPCYQRCSYSFISLFIQVTAY